MFHIELCHEGGNKDTHSKKLVAPDKLISHLLAEIPKIKKVLIIPWFPNFLLTCAFKKHI